MSSNFKQIVQKLNSSKHLDEKEKFHLDLVYNSNLVKYDVGLPNVEYIGKADSIINDIAVVPSELIIPVCSIPANYSIVKWMNRNIFTPMLEDLLNDKLMSLNTRLVRFRIAGNMAINNSILITKEERIEWNLHFKQVFYNRCLAISDFYFLNILELPF